MSFTSISFIIFVLGVIVLYYLIPKKAQWVLLLCAGIVFYYFCGIKAMAYLLFTTATTFFAGIVISAFSSSYEEKKQSLEDEDRKKLRSIIQNRKKWAVAITLLLNFGVLFLVKYYDFTSDAINSLLGKFGCGAALPQLSLLLPMGLSFYMFQSIGYVIDVYRGKYPPQRNFLKFALFVSFFPQMVQGPISRYDSLAPQLYSEKQLDFENLQKGFQLALWGYFKKLVIADRCAVIAGTVFGAYREYGGSVILLGAVAYSIQLYCDFSGGIEITRGIARCFGIDLEENFKRPYLAYSLSEYWRRWHITLGSWMRDYLFYPISLSKPFMRMGKWARKHIPGRLGKMFAASLSTFIVFFVIGIWHGDGWKYVFYGIWNGTIITASLLMTGWFSSAKKALHIKDGSKLWLALRILWTNIIVLIGRYITRADGLRAAFSMIKRTVLSFDASALFDGTVLLLGLNAIDFYVIIAGCIFMFIMELFVDRGIDLRSRLDSSPFKQYIVLTAFLLVFAVFGIFREGYISSEFIYKQF